MGTLGALMRPAKMTERNGLVQEACFSHWLKISPSTDLEEMNDKLETSCSRLKNRSWHYELLPSSIFPHYTLRTGEVVAQRHLRPSLGADLCRPPRS